MVRAMLVFVPPGGGEADYQLTFDLPGVPSTGDYISVSRKGVEKPGYEHFIVRRSWWTLEIADQSAVVIAGNGAIGKLSELIVECEFARGTYDSESHKVCCDAYDAKAAKYQKNLPVKSFDQSCY